MFITPFMLAIAVLVLLVVVLTFAACIVSLRKRIEYIDSSLSKFHKGLNSTNERIAQLFEPTPDPHVDAMNHFEHRLNNLHNQLADLCAPVAHLPKGEAAFIPDMTARNHNDWSVLLADLIQQADHCGFALTVDFSVPVDQ